MRRIALFVFWAACGGSSSNTTNPMMTADAPPAPTMLTISGTVTAKDATGSTPLSGVLVAAYKTTDENTPVTTAMSDGSGAYTLTVMTDGTALDGYLKATQATYMDTYLYPPKAISADFNNASVIMVTPSTFDLLANTLCAANQMTADGTIAAIVVDGQGSAVGGAAVSSNPAASKYCYNANGLPSRSATSTATDGVGYMFNVTGQATVTATKSGSTFASHPVKARAGALTTTLITP